jgi:hypothetical protein
MKPSDYWVLSLSKGKSRLLKLSGRKLSEINDKSFPSQYTEQFQFESKSGPPKVAYYDDESRVDEIRLHAYFRHVHHLIQPYLKAEDLPIILLCINSYKGDFERVTHLDKKIVRTIHGNYDRHSVAQLRTLLQTKLRLDRTSRASSRS